MILRQFKGAPLTYEELDGNFVELSDRIVSIVDDGGVPAATPEETAEGLVETKYVSPFTLKLATLQMKSDIEVLTANSTTEATAEEVATGEVRDKYISPFSLQAALAEIKIDGGAL